MVAIIYSSYHPQASVHQIKTKRYIAALPHWKIDSHSSFLYNLPVLLYLYSFCSKIPFDAFRNISHQATQLILQKLCPEPTLSKPPVPFPSKELEDIKHRTRQVLSSRTCGAVQRNTEEFIWGHNQHTRCTYWCMQGCPWTILKAPSDQQTDLKRPKHRRRNCSFLQVNWFNPKHIQGTHFQSFSRDQNNPALYCNKH